jgi:hypothetical protein
MDSMTKFLSIKQEANEPLSDYFNRYKKDYDTSKALFGTKIFDAATEKLIEYTTAHSSTERMMA